MAELLSLDAGEFDQAADVEFGPLDEPEICILESRFPVTVARGSHEIVLHAWNPKAGLPCRLHTGRELSLMLARKKPLAVFAEGIGMRDGQDRHPGHFFDPLIDSGLLAKIEYCEPNDLVGSPMKGLHITLYALASEAWRLEAYIALRLEARKSGWNEALTRREGSLLGYEDWQNDAFMALVQSYRDKAP